MKLTQGERAERHGEIVVEREMTRNRHIKARRHFIQSKTTRKVFSTSLTGRVSVTHDQKPYPHSSSRQQARYARQIAAGKLRMDGVDV